jgi:hypothetical protein
MFSAARVCILAGQSSRFGKRKIGGTESASGADPLASIWIAEHPCNLGALDEFTSTGPRRTRLN